MSNHKKEFETCMMDITCKASLINPTFRDGDPRKLTYWVNQFPNHRKFSSRMRLRNSFISEDAMQSVKIEYCERTMPMDSNPVKNTKYLIHVKKKNIVQH